MAIPICVTIACPIYSVSKDATFADTAFNPARRISVNAPFKNNLWPQTKVKENGIQITYLDCVSRNESNFNTPQYLARPPFTGAPSNSGKTPRPGNTPGSGLQR